MEELTLEKFEEASEVVRQVTSETKLVYSFCTISEGKISLKIPDWTTQRQVLRKLMISC